MNMTDIKLPMEFESEMIEETEENYIFSIPQHIQDFLKEKNAKYIHIRFIRFLDKQDGHP